MAKHIIIIMALVAIAIANPIELQGRIVGGSEAVLGQFPYQVSLKSTMTANRAHFCGGSIINNRWILSATHCTINRAQNTILIVVGSVLLNSGGVTHISSRIINHPNYDRDTIANDVSMVQTSTYITFNENVQPIALGSAFIGAGVNAIITGWGGTAVTGGPAPNNLQRLVTTTLTNADCLNRMELQNQRFVLDSKICTLTQAGEGTCQGDSGGPLVAGDDVIGIASWNIPCALGFPDGFDRVAFFRTWILDSIA
jgi:trypsin